MPLARGLEVSMVMHCSKADDNPERERRKSVRKRSTLVWVRGGVGQEWCR